MALVQPVLMQQVPHAPLVRRWVFSWQFSGAFAKSNLKHPHPKDPQTMSTGAPYLQILQYHDCDQALVSEESCFSYGKCCGAERLGQAAMAFPVFSISNTLDKEP